jgi:uncharacterized protein YndB with AHSA1/START domain
MSVEPTADPCPRTLDTGPDTIGREITIAAPADVVFAYFTDPAKHILWQGSAVQLEPRPGGRLRVEFGPGYVAAGEYLTIDPPRRLVFTWGWEEQGSSVVPPGSSTVEITLTPDGESTIVRLRHSGLPIDTFAFHGAGWDEGLIALARTAPQDVT